MKNAEQWTPTKFRLVGGRWRASRDPKDLAVSSRVTSDRAVASYQRAIERYARGHLLDFGCGTAPLYGVYRPRVDAVTTVDWSSSAHGLTHVDVVADLNQPTGLPAGAFDTVLSTSVVEHIRDPAVWFGEIARLLAPGGVAIVSTPFLYPLHEVPHDYHRFTEHGLAARSADAGLEVVELVRFGGLPEVLADLLTKLVARPRWLCSMLWAGLDLGLRLPWARRASQRTAARFPLGYTVVLRRKESGS